MDSIALNLVSALAIGAIIATMASLKNNKARALVYSFPIPITIALIATGGIVNTTHLIGMILGILFLWAVALMHAKRIPILVADVVGAVAYLVVGYFAISFITIPFYLAVALIAVGWVVFVYLYRKRGVKDREKAPVKIHPLVKLPVVSVFAYGLLSLKAVFAGIIVTFPFSGVFAVIENRHMLERLAATFTRNSIAILGLFVTAHALGEMNVLIKMAICWGVYLVILRLVVKFTPYVRT